MYVCMYVCMHACMHACMYVCMYVRTYVCMYVCMCVCVCIYIYICMYVCMHVCMYVCMYVCIYIYIYIHTHICITLVNTLLYDMISCLASQRHRGYKQSGDPHARLRLFWHFIYRQLSVRKRQGIQGFLHVCLASLLGVSLLSSCRLDHLIRSLQFHPCA